MNSETCVHHWMIETPNGTYSNGTCKKCGATKEFYNYKEEDTDWRKRGSLKFHKSPKGWYEPIVKINTW